jgi:hypothetical protein
LLISRASATYVRFLGTSLIAVIFGARFFVRPRADESGPSKVIHLNDFARSPVKKYLRQNSKRLAFATNEMITPPGQQSKK